MPDILHGGQTPPLPLYTRPIQDEIVLHEGQRADPPLPVARSRRNSEAARLRWAGIGWAGLHPRRGSQGAQAHYILVGLHPWLGARKTHQLEANEAQGMQEEYA